MSELSQKALRSLLSQRTPETWVEYLTIDSEDLGEPVRVCRNGEAIERTEGTFYPYGFSATLPNSIGDEIPSSTVTVDNADLELTEAMAKITDTPTARLEIGLASQPNTIEIGPFDFSLKQGTVTMDAVTFSLGFEEGFYGQTAPTTHYLPSNSPGLFQ